MNLRWSLLIVMLTYGCKFNSSALQHVPGATRIDVDESKFAPCDRSDFDPKYAEVNDYLSALLTEIMRKNPETFKGVFAPEKICIYAVKHNKGKASAQRGTRTIQVGYDFLKTMTNDAHLAGVLAHELAHITRDHGAETTKGSVHDLDYEFEVDPAWDQYIPAIAERPDVKSLRGRLSALSQEAANLRKIDEEFEGKFSQFAEFGEQFAEKNGFSRGDFSRGNEQLIKLFQERHPVEIARFQGDWQRYEDSKTLDRLIDIDKQSVQVKLEIEAIVKKTLPVAERITWAEREADDVGLEFFVRAGFDPASYTIMFQGFIHELDAELRLSGVPESFGPCKQKIEQALAGTGAAVQVLAIDTSAGLSRAQIDDNKHPTPCYRWYQALRELAYHKDYYAPFMGRLTEVLPGRLKYVQSLPL